MHAVLAALLVVACTALAPAAGQAAQAGWRTLSVPAVSGSGAPTTVALYYPTDAAERTIPMGPFPQQVAPQAPSLPRYRGLLLVSHGMGGSEIGHGTLAAALARRGYLVAAMRHPGDHWQDMSLLEKQPERYFDERPRQASRVLDALLRDPDIAPRIAADAAGPRVGAFGHSAGGYTVLALAGGVPQRSRLVAHCTAHQADDPIFCGVRGDSPATAAPDAAPAAPLADPRVRAVAALSPVGVPFSAVSLAAIRVPVALYVAEGDRFLVPRFHADWIAQNVPGLTAQRVAGAGHFVFHDMPTSPIPTPDGGIDANPPGFDRAAFLAGLADALGAFFDRALGAAGSRD